MKTYNVLAACGMLAGSLISTAYAEGNLFYPETKTLDGMRASSTVIRALEQNDSIHNIQLIGLNRAALDSKNTEFTLNFDQNLSLTTRQTHTYPIDKESYAWVGEIDLGLGQQHGGKDAHGTAINPNQAVFAVHGDRVFGQILIEDLVFEIRTLEKGDGYLMVQRDFSVLSYKDDTPADSFPIKEEADQNTNRMASNIVNIIQVGTTEAARDAGGNSALGDAMRFFITQSNQVYNNNGLDLEVRNAGLYLGGAEPRISSSQLLSRLRGSNDGYLDTVPTSLRNSTGADLVVLVTTFLRNQGLCGQADAIGASQGRAFFLVDHDCTNFTFVHEAGHLFGARHDNDPTTSPFRFGHGFVSQPGNFRTIMAVSSNPQPRVAAFSTPNRTISGRPIGTASFRDNERVHRQRASTVAGFR
ncbi:M12 family metallo-peptidase [Marinicella sp. W31]|uniref:M12 family metallo-peptidase n=1 Tax=Marinicella sp. W31 TaxID=3023713 RepID=UPI003757BB89